MAPHPSVSRRTPSPQGEGKKSRNPPLSQRVQRERVVAEILRESVRMTREAYQGMGAVTMREGREANPRGVLTLFSNNIARIWRKRTQEAYHVCCLSVARVLGLISRKFVWMPRAVDQGLGAGTTGRAGKRAIENRLSYIFINSIARIWRNRTKRSQDN